MIVDHLVDNGLMEPRQLFEPPFTDFHDHGVTGVLGDHAEKVINVIKQINRNAVAV